MRKYTDNDFLMEFIAQGDIKEIKKELLNSIFFLKGDQQELNAAVNYIKEKTNFDFDKHNGMLAVEDTDLKNQYAEEVINMEENYSRERFYKLIDLYGKAFGDSSESASEIQSVSKDNNASGYKSKSYGTAGLNVSEEKRNNSPVYYNEDEDNKKKTRLIIGGIIIGAVLLYLILD